MSNLTFFFSLLQLWIRRGRHCSPGGAKKEKEAKEEEETRAEEILKEESLEPPLKRLKTEVS